MKFCTLDNRPDIKCGVTKRGEIYFEMTDGSQIILTPEEVSDFYSVSVEQLGEDNTASLEELVSYYSMFYDDQFDEPEIFFEDDDGSNVYLVMNNGVLCTTTDKSDKDMYEPITVTRDYMLKRYKVYSITLGDAK